jgi:hypothetical protein
MMETMNEMKQLSEDFFSVIPGIERASNVPVLEAKDLKEQVFKDQWVSENKACLIKGAVANWPAISKWREKAYWLSSLEDFKVMVYPHRNFNDQKRNKGELMGYHAAIERLFQNQDHIFSIPSEQITPRNEYANLIKDLPGFSFLPSPPMPRNYPHMRFFMYRRAATAWHYHNIDESLMCQINGSKKVALFPPRIPDVKKVTQFLGKELHLDGHVLDRSLDLKPMIVNVEEGDALYIPPYWHHAVVPNDGEIGFTLAYCWASPWHILGDFSNYFVRNLYAQGVWPINKFTPFLPFLGGYAGFLHYKKKLVDKAQL